LFVTPQRKKHAARAWQLPELAKRFLQSWDLARIALEQTVPIGRDRRFYATSHVGRHIQHL
jgi:hypothetical protein